MNQEKHTHFMSLALQEAKKGFCNTKPNPLVGAVITKNDTVIAKSYHKEFGKDHAEVNALKKINHNAKDCTIYVTLEPCSHYGNTPPCVNAIIEAGIKKVVIPFKDPSKKINGEGIEKLKAHGISVVTGVCVEESFNINQDFLYHSITGKPLVTLKWASSIDGKLTDFKNNRKQLTNKLSNEQVHLIRAQNHGILIGANTLNVDNPALSIRSQTKKCNRVNQKFIVSSYCNNINSSLDIFKKDNNVNIITFENANKDKIKELQDKGINIIKIEQNNESNIPASKIISTLGDKGIISLLVEGGPFVISSFILDNIVDKIECFKAPLLIGGDFNITSFDAKLLKDKNPTFTLTKLINHESDVQMSFESNTYKEWKKRSILCLQE